MRQFIALEPRRLETPLAKMLVSFACEAVLRSDFNDLTAVYIAREERVVSPRLDLLGIVIQPETDHQLPPMRGRDIT